MVRLKNPQRNSIHQIQDGNPGGVGESDVTGRTHTAASGCDIPLFQIKMFVIVLYN